MHIEDFNQIYRQYPDAKYDNRDYNMMARDIYRLLGADALRDFVRRLVFTIAIGNTDMHLKKWSVIYRDGRTPELAPVYDMLCTSIYNLAGRNELALQLGGVKAFNAVDDAAFRDLAKRADVASRLVLAAAHDMRDGIAETWKTYRACVEQDVPRVAQRANDLLKSVPFFGTTRAAVEGPARGHEEVS